MASRKKMAARRRFDQRVMQRDNFTCKMCGEQYTAEDASELIAHPITREPDIPNGGWVPENGITLCTSCAQEAVDSPHIPGQRPADLYGKIGSTFKKAFQKSEFLDESESLEE